MAMACFGMPACDEGVGHAVRRPRLLRAGLEHQADLHRNDRQPERVHAGRVATAAPCRAPATGLVADRHAAGLDAVAARRGCSDPGRASGSRGSCPCWSSTKWFFSMLNLHMCSGRPVVADCMRANWSGVCVPSPSGSSALAYRSPAFFIICEQLLDGDLAQHVAGPLGVAHVALDQAAVGPADLGEHLAGGEVDDLVDLEALVRLAPAEDGDVDHECSLPSRGSATSQ